MENNEKLFLSALSESLHDYKESVSPAAEKIASEAVPADTVRELWAISQSQKTVPLLYDFLCIREIEIPPDISADMKHEIASYAIAFYQNTYFSDFICNLFDKADIPYALIKGVLLSSLYPKPECRRFSDIDILINDTKAFKQASALLLEYGFTREPSNGDHHHEFYLEKKGRNYLVELHQNFISSQMNKKLNNNIKKLYHSLTLDKKLPVTLEAVYLLLHMLQHILDAGFGIKLLCDWVLYLEKNTEKLDSGDFENILKELELFSFSKNITIFCAEYLGLTTYPKCFHYETLTQEMKQMLESLSEDIFSGGEYGKNDSSRMILMKGNFRLSDYFFELHRQTKKNYPKLWKTILPLPVLWGMTGFKFIYNNKQIRHTDTGTILKTTKKRQRLLEHLNIPF